jgi:hypothetical protein
VDERGLCTSRGRRRRLAGERHVFVEERGMNPSVPHGGPHPALGEEVVAMDDVDVHVGYASVTDTSDLKERMKSNG